MSFQEIDFKSDRNALPRRQDSRSPSSGFRIKFPIKLLLISSALVVIGFSATSWQPAAKGADSTRKSARLHYSLELPELIDSIISNSDEAIATPSRDNTWEIITIESGDTLASIFSSAGIPATTTHQIATLNEQTKSLRTIKPGQKIHLLLDQQGRLRRMKYIVDITKTLSVRREEDQSFISQILNHQLDAYPVFREGVIETSLFEAAAQSNISESLVMELANIFGWDIDFALDIRRGDRFGVVYNELYREGVKIRDGRILAAEFVNNGRLYKAVYYTDPKGDGDYFNEEGKSMRKAFLRSPVGFARVSSRFSNKRWHPVLSKWRAHKGVDYAARRGTPVRASGDGKITLIGKKGGYGRAIFIQHGGRYTTVYGHLNAYARGVSRGKRVKQGQIIGYVGSSGLATGPHLHYEFRVNGVHRNPLTVSLPAAKPVHPSYQEHFKQNTRAYLSMLKLK